METLVLRSYLIVYLVNATIKLFLLETRISVYSGSRVVYVDFFRWVEKYGYLIATMEKLKQALKQIHLRKVIVEVEHDGGS